MHVRRQRECPGCPCGSATAPASVTNTATVSGGGDINAANNTAADVTTVIQPQRTFSGLSATGTGTITASFTSASPTCGFAVAQFIPLEGGPASPPAGSAPVGVTFPHGLFDFTITGCAPGSTVNFTIVYPQPLPPGTLYYKYGPEPTNPAPHWYVLDNVAVNGNTVTFSIADGGKGDDDLAANGTIVDQGGPGAAGAVTAVPTLSEWALVLMALLMLGIAGRRWRYVRKPGH